MSDNGPSGETAAASFSRLRLFAAVVATVVVATGPTVYVAGRAVGDTRAEIADARLRFARFAARQADRVVAEAFNEVAAAADACVPTGPDGAGGCTVSPPAFNGAVLAFGPDGSLASAEPGSSRAWIEGGNVALALEDLAAADRRAVSVPFAVATTGHVMVGLGVPVYGGNGSRAGTVVGLLDLTEPVIDDLVVPALRMGPTGHADLVDARGLVLASTNPNHVLEPGDHPEFYERVATDRAPTVEEVPHDAGPDDVDRSRSHVMAYAPLRHAPWGVAIGAGADETFGTVASLQRQLVVAGLAGSGALLVGIAGAVWWSGRASRGRRSGIPEMEEGRAGEAGIRIGARRSGARGRPSTGRWRRR